jgi:outer membrane cobalamin receptor
VLAEAYYQNLDNLVVDLDRVSGAFANKGDGTSYGVDIVVNGTIREGIYATATYSYNDAVIDRKDGRGDVSADFSREHVATLGLTWEISDRWKVGLRYKHGRPRFEARNGRRSGPDRAGCVITDRWRTNGSGATG